MPWGVEEVHILCRLESLSHLPVERLGRSLLCDVNTAMVLLLRYILLQVLDHHGTAELVEGQEGRNEGVEHFHLEILLDLDVVDLHVNIHKVTRTPEMENVKDDVLEAILIRVSSVSNSEAEVVTHIRGVTVSDV